MSNKKEKKKAAKKALKKSARIISGVIAAVIAVIAIVCLVYAIKFFKDGTETAAAVVLLIVGVAGIIVDFKIAVKIKDSIFDEKMKEKFGYKHTASATSANGSLSDYDIGNGIQAEIERVLSTGAIDVYVSASGSDNVLNVKVTLTYNSKVYWENRARYASDAQSCAKSYFSANNTGYNRCSVSVENNAGSF